MAGKSGGKGCKKAGSRKEKCKRYRDFHTREKNKVRRVLKSSGREEAQRYAVAHGVVGYLAGLMR
jgi:hypothetical protein